MYNYSYYKVDADGNVSTTPIYVPTAEYLYAPIEANSSWRDLTINAWLVDENGEKVPNSDAVFEYEFVDMNAPVIEPDSGSYTSGTRVTITNEYPDREDIIIYYTTDGSDPADEQNQNRMEYADEAEIRITKAMTVRAVYCVKGEGTEANFYSLETSADYTLRYSGGGGGGGGGVYRTPTPSPSPTPFPRVMGRIRRIFSEMKLLCTSNICMAIRRNRTAGRQYYKRRSSGDYFPNYAR